MDAFMLNEIENMKELLQNIINESENEDLSIERQEYLDYLYLDTDNKIKKLEKKFLTFTSAEEMLEKLQTTDMYNADTGEYVFLYSETGDICTYTLEEEEAKKLAQKTKEHHEYWGAFLGIGGRIWEAESGDNLEFCKTRFTDSHWIDVSPETEKLKM